MSHFEVSDRPSTKATLKYFESTARHYDAACAADTKLQDIQFYLEEYGSYDKEPISVCKQMIFIAEKK